MLEIVCYYYTKGTYHILILQLAFTRILIRQLARFHACSSSSLRGLVYDHDYLKKALIQSSPVYTVFILFLPYS